MPNVLVIGGSGFVSGTIVQRAQALGHQVWTLTRGKRPIAAGAHNLTADRGDHEAFAHALAGAHIHWDLVIDCIGFTPADIQQDIAVLPPLADHLVFVSSDFVYDPARRRIPQNEETDAYVNDGYGGQKRHCEQELSAVDTSILPWTIVRPCHIYGPGSQLGCLPSHSRDPQLIARLRKGEPLQLVGGGYFLQQPLFAADLAQTILDMAGRRETYGQTFCVAGPEIVESRTYYRLIAEIVGVGLDIEEVSISSYLRDHPEAAPFLCHRVYDLYKLQQSGVATPQTSLVQGLQQHVASLLEKDK